MKLSAIVITRNEEANLERCLRSVDWADEIIVVDSGSTDKTVEIAKSFSATVFNPEWKGFGPGKQYALEQASGDWIISIDADEEVSFTLKGEIIELIKEEPEYSGYCIPRKTQFLGKWILHSGWYPDYVLRLFRKSAGRFTPALVHEKVELNGPAGRLNNPLLHYSYPTLEDYVRKLDHYSTLRAAELFQAGKRCTVYCLTVKPVLSFFRKLIFQSGWRDGWEGFLIASLTSAGTLLKYAKLRSLYIEADKNR